MLRDSSRMVRQLDEIISGFPETYNPVTVLTADLEDLSLYVSDLMTTIPNPIYVVSPAGIIVDGNSALERLTGRSLEELLGEAQKTIFLQEETAIEIDKQTRQMGTVAGKSAILLTKDGTTVPVSIYSQARKDAGGKTSYIVALVDISEHKRIETALERSVLDLAETISRAIGCRDPYTEDHGRRVAQLCRLTGEKMRLSDEQLKSLYIGGLLHDVGKIAVPEIILAKPGSLTEEEYNLIKSHTKHGYAILKDTAFPGPVAEMALYHHERLDGSGYPLGICTETLPIETRIVAVCDVVEAMSSHRPYRLGRSKKLVMKELRSARGIKYASEIVDTVLDLIDNGAFDLSSSRIFDSLR